MSHYLRFALRHAGAPIPHRIAIVRTGLDWADEQLLSELRFQFPQCAVDPVEDVHSATHDLLVLAYPQQELFAGAPTAGQCRNVNTRDVAWVMLYGLDYRRIKVLPARKLLAYYRWAIVLRKLEGWLARTHVTGVIRRARGLWRRLCE